MAIADDMTSIVLIAAAVLAAAILATSLLLSNARSQAQGQDDTYHGDFASSGVDVFMHSRENNTNMAFNVLLGDYLSTGNPIVTTTNATFDIRNASRDQLDAIFGRQNYYLRASPKISDAKITFVVDGTDSLKAERLALATNMNTFRGNLTQIFNNTNVNLNITVYIISNGNEAILCQPFAIPGVTCKRIGFSELYNNVNPVGLTPPPQYFLQDSFAQKKPSLFFEGDWVAGSLYVGQKYAATAQSQTGPQRLGLQFLIPVSNKLSTTSVADECLAINSTTFYSNPEYVVCALCNDVCPASRSATFLQPVSTYLNQSSTIAIPVYSSRCSFSYLPVWNGVSDTAYTRNWVSFPIQNSICEQATCGGCEPGVPATNLSAFCFHNNCETELRNQMTIMATTTGGAVVDLVQPDDLTREVLRQISNIVSQLGMQAGTYNETRTRHVIERNILLPNFEKSPVRIWVYDDPQ